MIQRIQTLYLLLASGSFGATFFSPFASSSVPVPATVLEDARFDVSDSTVMMIGLGAAALAALGAVFLYGNRKLQVNVAWGALSLAVLATVVGVLTFMEDGAAIGAVDVQEQAGAGLPILGGIATLLGLRGIKRDEKLVRSADRLR